MQSQQQVIVPPRRLAGWIAVVLAGLLAGCATNSTLPEKRTVRLDFLVNDQTTEPEVLLRLGQPSARFQGEKILTYRLAAEMKDNGYFVVARDMNPQGWPTWVNAKYSLVLVFDSEGVLRKHSLVEVY